MPKARICENGTFKNFVKNLGDEENPWDKQGNCHISPFQINFNPEWSFLHTRTEEYACFKSIDVKKKKKKLKPKVKCS